MSSIRSIFSRLPSRWLAAVILLLLIAGASGGPVPVYAATTTVNTHTISDNPNDNKCDLWEALQTIARTARRARSCA